MKKARKRMWKYQVLLRNKQIKEWMFGGDAITHHGKSKWWRSDEHPRIVKDGTNPWEKNDTAEQQTAATEERKDTKCFLW